jgi:alpha-glucosidase (family GH31 glycosyl hydrolase)
MIYTCLYEASTNGGTCFDPLFYYYPYDLHTYVNYEHTFMVAGAVKVSPILEKLAVNQTTYQSYFPAGKWVNLADYNEVIDSNGENKTL